MCGKQSLEMGLGLLGFVLLFNLCNLEAIGELSFMIRGTVDRYCTLVDKLFQSFNCKPLYIKIELVNGWQVVGARFLTEVGSYR